MHLRSITGTSLDERVEQVQPLATRGRRERFGL